MAIEVTPRARLDPAIFRLPVERIRRGYYSDAYFVYTKQVLEAEGDHPRVTMQVFQKHESLLGGIDEALAVLKLCAGYEAGGTWVPGWDQLEVSALREGRTPMCEIHENVLSFAMVEAAVAAVERGERVEIDELLEQARVEAIAAEADEQAREIMRSWGSVREALVAGS